MIHIHVYPRLAVGLMLCLLANGRADTLISKQTILWNGSSSGITYTVPSGANRLVVKAWGAGGGGGNTGNSNEGSGGGGAYGQVAFDIPVHDTIKFYPGGGGKGGLPSGTANGGFGMNFSMPVSSGGGGGNGGVPGGGGGGGSTGMQILATTGHDAYISFVVGGGGGKGALGGSSAQGGYAGNPAGSGGGGNGSSGGSGATVTANGAAASGNGMMTLPEYDENWEIIGYYDVNVGNASQAGGSSYNGTNNYGGGGGGGGKYVGGGGGGGTTQGGGGGGGGSSAYDAFFTVGYGWTNPTELNVATSYTSGNGRTPGNVFDSDYPGGGVGYGGVDGDGGNGAIVVIAYQIARKPLITSPLNANGFIGVPTSYTIIATNSPTSYAATSLPAGMSVNTSTGIISGSPTTASTYNSTINATNAVGTGPNSTLVWTVTADSTAPSVPTGLQATLLTSSSFRLSWTPSTDNAGVTAYEIKRDSTSLGTVTTTASDITGVTSGTTYSMTVRARDHVGNWSAWSSALSVAQATVTAPSAPGSLNYADRTDRSITLIWNASLGALPVVSYKIYRGGVEVGTTSDLVFTDTGLPANTSQTYTVKAVDAAGTLSAASGSLAVSTTQNATLDSDGDGVPNAMETVMGTNANSAGTNDSSNQTQLKINHPVK